VLAAVPIALDVLEDRAARQEDQPQVDAGFFEPG
jgi:hypothetical protein